MSNRLAVMRLGEIEQLGEPEEVYENPGTEFVAGFLGASNMLEGELKENRGGTATVLATGGASFTVPSERVPADAGSQVKVGVRPEKITISPDGGAGVPAGLNGVAGLLRMATYIGVSHQYKVDVGTDTEMTVYVQNLGSEPAPSPGDRVQLTWRPEHTFVVKPSAPLTAEEEEE